MERNLYKMYYNCEWINDNICVHDSHDMNFEPIKAKRFFLIVHHTKNEKRVNEAAQKIISANYDYISIFGEMAPLWKKAIEKFNDYNLKVLYDEYRRVNENI